MLTVMAWYNGGFIVRSDPAEFTALVLSLLSVDVLYAKQAAEALEHAKSWTIGTMSARLETIYRDTLVSYAAKQ